MKKVTVMYTSETGEIHDVNGLYLCNAGVGLALPEDSEKQSDTGKSKVSDLAALKGAGFTADEIMQMKREGLV